MRRVTVALEPPYDIVVGPGVEPEAELARHFVGLLTGRRRVAVVTQTAIGAAYGPDFVEPLREAGIEAACFTMGDGEAAKSLGTVEALASELAEWGLLRGDAVVGLGGGVVGDTAGFVAAVYHRGIAVVQAPTTLLAMVDAAIGGKTAVNLPEGKNLVGAFHQPIGVVAALSTLATLTEREFRSGLGEVAKYALMPQGGDILDVLRSDPDAVLARDPARLEPVVAGCAAIKAAVVASDPFERTGIRATLNYGHTLGHALETAGRYDLHHGEAVAVGLVFAAHLAAALERITPATLDRHVELIEGLGLPVAIPSRSLATPLSGTVSSDELLTLMRRDKKAHGGLTFVLPAADGSLTTVDDPPAPALEIAFRAVGVGG